MSKIAAWTIRGCATTSMLLGAVLAACSGGGSHAATTPSGGDGGITPGAGSGSCKSDADCALLLPATSPPNCAVGKCDALQGGCTFVPLDQDGDGHPAANCKAIGSGVIQAGDDCNDNDPNLYPGHSETCSQDGDGGLLVWPTGSAPDVCQGGQVSCNADGTESQCTGIITCTGDQTCVANKCVGTCGPGETQCSGVGGAPASPTNTLWACSTTGAWQNSQSCTAGNTTCVDAVSTGGSSTASCAGSCAPGETACAGNAVATCTTDGAWGTPVGCVNSTCQAEDAGVAASCEGACSGNQTNCSGNGLQQCVGGQWGTPTACVGSACVVAAPGSASCVGGCVPNTPHCSGQQPTICSLNGTWVNNGPACTHQTCVASASASCQGVCAPSDTMSCGNCDAGTADCTSGAWGSCSGQPPCTAGNVTSCTTCDTTLGFHAGTQTCSSSCQEETCVANPNVTWTGGEGAFSHQCGTQSCGFICLGMIWAVTAGTPSCYAQFGPYVTMPAGSYTVTFILETESSSAEADLDVYNGSTSIAAVPQIVPANTNSGSYSLDFHLDSCTPNIEFRVTYKGSGWLGIISTQVTSK